ncbi:MAG TPA: [citrate (pro-3S)-lyase] ligase [Clostridia bacterium]|nr:[citrate (pro-3S)-lyase] ligase [Clostridia bacterium]
MELETGALNAAREKEISAFLTDRGLTLEGGADYCAVLRDESGRVAACGCLDGGVIKYVAVSPAAEGEGAAATIVSDLVNHAYRVGKEHLFLFTKPGNERMFRSLGFYPVARTSDAVMLEDRRDGIDRFITSLPKAEGIRGACVVNCDPFTLGHRYLIETAAENCDFLYVFVVSEDAAHFPAKDRYELVQLGTADIKNLAVVRSEDYLVSRATFPAYFIKDRVRAEDVRTEMDIAVFGGKIAPGLGITRRFVGTEPFCPVTRAYNEKMRELLPGYGVDFIEIPRKDNISASAVRRHLKEDRFEEIEKLVPPTTYAYLKSLS